MKQRIAPIEELFHYLYENNQDLYNKALVLKNEVSLFDSFRFIAKSYNLPRPKLSDPIAGTCSKMLAMIRAIEESASGTLQ